LNFDLTDYANLTDKEIGNKKAAKEAGDNVA
jgi:hypothetical protein